MHDMPLKIDCIVSIDRMNGGESTRICVLHYAYEFNISAQLW